MKTANQKRMSTEKLVFGALLTALVIVLQFLGSFIRFGPFAISLVLIPIVIGAATCGPKVSTWLGFVFGVVVLFTDAAAFLAISVAGTVITVLLKGMACGLVAGIVYQLLAKKHPYVAVIAAAIVCPLVNTGIFLLGSVVFFLEALREWGVAAGFNNVFAFLIIGMVGLNFLVEMATNIVLSPVIVRIMNIKKHK